MARVNVEPDVLKWAVQRSGKEELINQKFDKFDSWLDGTVQPTLKQLEGFANFTSTPLGFLFLKTPPIEKEILPDFRTIDDSINGNLNPDLTQIIDTMKIRQDFMRDYFIDNGYNELAFVGIHNSTEVKKDEVISLLRNVLQLEKNWQGQCSTYQDAINLLVSRLEENRIIIQFNSVNKSNKKLDVSIFRGFVLVDKIAPLIFVNGADSKSAQIFTIIHEMVHLIIGESGLVSADPRPYHSKNNEEIFCNSVAATFLCPDREFTAAWHTHLGDGKVYETLANKFKVSPIVIGRRAVELNLIEFREFKIFYDDYIKELSEKLETRTTGGPSFYILQKSRLQSLFPKAVKYQLENNSLLFKDASRLTGFKGNTLSKFLEMYN